MKTTVRNLFAAFVLVTASLQVHAQGSLVIDQESATGPVEVEGNGNADGLYLTDQPVEQFLQSFIPSLSTIDYVALEFESSSVPATVEVELYDSSTGSAAALLATTTAVTMPSGFNNNRLGIAGVENFYFSTPISLISGDSYYLEPVLVSGGAQWAFVTIGDTYPNGELLIDGYPTASPNDSWFQEGIVAVPEPSTFALIGFTCLLVIGFKLRAKLPVLMLAGLLLAVPVLSVNAAEDSVVQATASEAGLTQIPTSDLSGLTGTFWIATIDTNNGLIMLPPYPMLPTNMMDLPTFLITNNIYISDGTKGQISSSSTEFMSTSEASSAVQKQSQTVENLIEMLESPPLPPGGGDGGGTNPPPHYNGLPATSDTTNIWLLATNDADGSSLEITLMNASGINVQLLSTTNLLTPATNWDLGQILQGANVNYNNVFTPVPYTNAMTFFRVHQANPIMMIQNEQDSVEMNPTNASNPGHSGYLRIYYEGHLQSSNTTVYYSISGTAQNGVDYSNIPDSVVIPVGSAYAYIYINPFTNGLEPNQTVILTLTQSTNYLISPVNYLATNTITANPQVYPIANGDRETPCPNTPLSFNLSLNASDPRHLTLTNYSIATWPTHGMLLITNGLPNVTYIPTNCYEGNDSFTYTVSDGQYTSTPGTVSLIIGTTVYANAVSSQTCRGTPTGPFTLGGDLSCDITTNYEILSGPEYGVITGPIGSAVYTPTGTNFTGTDTFTFKVYDECGDAATNTGAIIVGDNDFNLVSSSVMIPTNSSGVSFTLSASPYGICTADTSDFIYAVTNGPANGRLTNISGANLTYIPNNGFEGEDSFKYVVSDGVFTSAVATATIYVVAGPILSTGCDPFGTAPLLTWYLDTNVTIMQKEGLGIYDFIVYRSTNPDFSDSSAIGTVSDPGGTSWNYWDSTAANGVSYYYKVEFESDEVSGVYYSPLSGIVETDGQSPNNLISVNSFWNVVTNLSDPTNIVVLQAPFSNLYPAQYLGLYPLPNSSWTSTTTWSNFTTMVIPTNTPLSQVQYSIAIDNYYYLYVNGTNVGYGNNYGNPAIWAPFQSFPTNVLHYGTNNVGVQITDIGDINYFSMVVTTNTCGY